MVTSHFLFQKNVQFIKHIFRKNTDRGRVLSPARPLGVHWTLDKSDCQTEAYTIAAWWSLGVSMCSAVLGRQALKAYPGQKTKKCLGIPHPYLEVYADRAAPQSALHGLHPFTPRQCRKPNN